MASFTSFKQNLDSSSIPQIIDSISKLADSKTSEYFATELDLKNAFKVVVLQSLPKVKKFLGQKLLTSSDSDIESNQDLLKVSDGISSLVIQMLQRLG
jgi:hypothetical protein